MKNKLYLINGPLGAGKTTVLKFLLSQPEFTDARVIENEFASTSIDSTELHDHITDIETIAGQCICCSTGTELVEALDRLSATHAPVIIEATGVANSLLLLEKLVVNDVLESYDIAQSFFVLDAAELHADASLMDQHSHEIAAADSVIITKTDLIATEATTNIVTAIEAVAQRPIIVALMGTLDLAQLAPTSTMLDYFARHDLELTNHDTNTNFTIIETSLLAITPAQLEASWPQLQANYGLKRLKGYFHDSEKQAWHVEATRQHIRFDQSSASSRQLVFIGDDARSIHAAVLKEYL